MTPKIKAILAVIATTVSVLGAAVAISEAVSAERERKRGQ